MHSETPEGRAFVARKLETFARRCPPAQPWEWRHGETLALLCEDHQLWVDGPIGTEALDGPHYAETLRIPGGVRRQGPWFVTMQGILHLPRASGGFTIDRTSLFSLWHERAGLISERSGEPGPHRAQSVNIREIYELSPTRCRNARNCGWAGPVRRSRPGSLPNIAAARFDLDVRFVTETEAQLYLTVAARADRYPIPVTLQLEARRGDHVNGAELGDLALRNSLGGSRRAGLETDRFQITFPAASARLTGRTIHTIHTSCGSTGHRQSM